MTGHREISSALIEHWLGHRRLTRRVIGAFPVGQLFTFTPAPPLRSFGELAWEIVGQSRYILDGLVTGRWGEPVWEARPAADQGAVLRAWDELTERLEQDLPAALPTRLNEPQTLVWGQLSGLALVLGALDNEIHHRGQGTVYLRLLGQAPPDFWERS